ncbi:DUF3618 domain-containing protein [Actinoplanes couchii]|uniref:DUF3618 domain-containing protein n=1 Tax=Actinoplanes couchii TaxID=403638 RepID=A0ABQ3X4R8_9ACTN|nr:DUF3618 domain-containing protein [Actinoplanes couchii]MDR6326263.1 ElaB/YqjD/DUF883 family membrane-anchored ribosome-binding protein [Actinoplanes couchii]GID53385.1 hypothetical protein Aco03nite_017890 [Actinoplanes couchii]
MSEKNGADKPDLVALRQEIRQTRSELGETVQALAARADVKARAREQVEETKQRALEQVEVTKQRVLTRAAEMTGRVRETVRETPPRELAVQAGERVRANPFPVMLTVAGIAAVAGLILILRGRR